MAVPDAETRPDAPPLRLAAVFDRVDPEHGPGFAADHPLVTDAVRRTALLAYLRAGAPVLMTPALAEDVVEAGRGAVVPMDFRTDGRWIWTDTVAYYLERYGLAPEPGLLAHIEAHGPYGWTPDPAVLERAVAAILGPPAEEGGNRMPTR